MDDQTVLLLNEVVKNAEMGKNTVTQLLGITDDERLKIHLNRQLAHTRIFPNGPMQCWRGGRTGRRQNAFTKLNAKMGVKIQTIYDKSPRKIAEMLIEGSHVGVTDMTIAIKDAPDATRALSRWLSACSMPKMNMPEN